MDDRARECIRRLNNAPQFSSSEVATLSALLRHRSARERMREAGTPDAFSEIATVKLARAMLTDDWSSVEKCVSTRTRVRTRMGALIGCVLHCRVPGDDERWAIHLVNQMVVRRMLPIAASQLRKIAEEIEGGKYTTRRNLERMLDSVVRLVHDGELNDEPRSEPVGRTDGGRVQA